MKVHLMENTFNATKVVARVGGRDIILETGRIANQADGAVVARCGETVVLVTVCAQPSERAADFFPLTVEYSEKMYAAGRIPGSFFRREIGRPSERETLVSRLIDRPVRPCFPKGYRDEVQILASVLSADRENDPDVLALTAASAAVMISPIPFNGPIAGCRVGRVDGEYVINPTRKERERSDLDIVMAASREAVVMVEGEASFVPEDAIVGALEFGHKAVQPLIEAQEALARIAGREKKTFTPPQSDAELAAHVESLAAEKLAQALAIPEKLKRKEARHAVKEEVKAALAADARFAEHPELGSVGDILAALEKKIVRRRIREEGRRIDGRDVKTVRPITIETAVLPRTHGSALFRRGETKSLVVTTLGSGTDEQRMDSLVGDVTKRFMLHYNFPPFSVGEVKPVRVSRREIGHGALAEKALKAILPSPEEFPFTVRVVAETVESNGSSSMAAVCGGCLSLMDAGIPVSAPVAGVAMGLIKEDDEFIVLTDILGDEDALGDMDFKIAGTADGVTAVQMDIKIAGIDTAVMEKAMRQAKEARLHILAEMAKALPGPRSELSRYAPQHEEIMVSPDAIRLIIGPGGKNIKQITTETEASIDIDDSGKVSIFAPTAESLELAKKMVLYYDQRAELGKNYLAKVRKIMEIGAIVELLPNLEALVHISQLDLNRVERTEDVARLGEEMMVKVIEVSGDRIRASRKAVLLEEQGIEWTPESTARPPRREGPRRDGPHRDGPRRDGPRRDGEGRR